MESPENNHSQRENNPSVENLLKRAKESFLKETGCNPQIPPLSLREKSAACSLRKISSIVGSLPFEKILPVSETLKDSSSSKTSLKELQKLSQDPRSSCWGIYARLNLRGQTAEKDENFYRAVRYSHIFFAKKSPLPSEEEIVKAVKETFETDQFPWRGKKEGFQSQPIKDPRLEGVNFSPTIVKVNQVTDLESIPITDENSPKILIISENFEENPTQTGLLVKRLLTSSPFVLVIKEKEEINVFQIIANHEFFDGVPAAYYLRNIIQRLGFEIQDIENIEIKTLENLLAEADQRETPNIDEKTQPFSVRSVILSEELVTHLNDLYQIILKNATEMGIENLSYETFIQLFIFWVFQTDGENIRGGSLRFNKQIDIQLEHYDVGNALLVFEALMKKDKNYLESKGYLFTKNDNKLGFGLARPGRENISKVISPLRKLPTKCWPTLNKISKETGAASAIAGQLMTSVIPEEINGMKLGGLGGPAMTEYQHTAFTITIIYDSTTNLPKRIIIRVKEKTPKEI